MAPRRRKNPADEWMPPRVYRGRSAFEWHPKGGGNVRLAPLSASCDEVWDAYRDARMAREQGAIFTVDKMLDNYFASDAFGELKPASRKDYKQSAGQLRPVLGAVRPEALTAPVFRQYMDRRGTKSKIRANRERALLGTAWAWNFERGRTAIPSPIPDVKPFREQSRERYVEDNEYQAVFDLAPLPIRIAMEIAYLCAARQADVLDLRWGRKGQTAPTQGQNAVVLEQGIYIRQGKTGKRQIKLWSPRLKAAVMSARAIESKIDSVYVIHNRHGQRYTASGFKAMFRRCLQRWLGAEANKEHPHWFTFHDLKAKGISDYEQGDKQEFSGHVSRAQMERYNRRIQEVPAHDPDAGGE